MILPSSVLEMEGDAGPLPGRRHGYRQQRAQDRQQKDCGEAEYPLAIGISSLKMDRNLFNYTLFLALVRFLPVAT